MIVTCLNGGLGNQMFQYAVARSLADRLGEPLQLDRRDLAFPGWGKPSFSSQEKGVVRNYGLGCYPLRAEFANPFDLAFRGFLVSRKARGFLEKMGLLRGGYIQEKGFGYQDLKPLPGKFHYLEGYWQSWKYFAWKRPGIVRDFTMATKATGKNARLLRKITAENSVCVHVRLGDYVNSSSTAAAHGNLTPQYYQDALKKVRRSGSRLTYYLFSDEPKKAIKLIKPRLRVTVVDHNGGEPQEDLRLMSACKYFVTANSSFSWWAAWLSQRKGKKVVSPKQWFAGLNHDTGDLIPKDWVQV